MPLFACEGCVRDLFVTEEELIERFTGKELWIWGRNDSGQLGDDTRVSRSTPIQTISGGTNWISIQLSKSGSGTPPAFSAGIKTDGTLWLWGDGVGGAIGNNSVIDRSSPVQTISGGTNWKNINLAKGGTAAATKTDGTLWLWGIGEDGQHGSNNIINRSSPVQTISGGTNWKTVSISALHASAIKTDGTLWVWGTGDYGALGNNLSGGFNRRSSPIQTVSGGTNWKSTSSNFSVTFAIKTDGTLWAWGQNVDGQLGLGDRILRSTPTQMASNGTMWRSISIGPFHGAGIKTDGTLWTWGYGGSGSLGNNSGLYRSSPVQTVSGGTNWRTAIATHVTTVAIKTDGTLWTWGVGDSGELGNNTSGVSSRRSSPVQTISGGTNWRTISEGSSYSSGGTRSTEF
jgi:alpha-tubulin suppressor-like RCC1 family protein